MKRAVKVIVYSMMVIITAFMLFSCSEESSGFNVQKNRFSQIKASYNRKNFYADSLSYYENPKKPMVRRGDYIWYYYWDGDASKWLIPVHSLAYIDPYSCEAVTLCQDKRCMHNTASITNHCILADMYKEQLLIENEEYIYFIRADKEMYSKAYGGVVYMDEDMQGAQSFNYKYDIIKYNLGSGDYWKLHSTEAGLTMNYLTFGWENIYFIEDTAVKIEYLVYQHNDDEHYYFQDSETGAIVTYPSMFFREIEDLTLKKIEDGYRYYEHKQYAGTKDQIILEYKYHESMFQPGMCDLTVIDNRLARKTYLVMELDRNGKNVKCLNSPTWENRVDIKSRPEYFGVIKNRIYMVVDGKFVCYDMKMTPESEFVLCDFSNDGKWYKGMKIDNVQFDQYSDNIYFRLKNEEDGGGTIAKVKVFGNPYRVVRKVDVMCGSIDDFQLTLEGLYFTVTGVESMDGNIYLVDYNEINRENAKYIVAYDREVFGKLYCPTSIFGDIYAYKTVRKSFPRTDGTLVEFDVLAGLYKYNPETKEITEIKLVDPKDKDRED